MVDAVAEPPLSVFALLGFSIVLPRSNVEGRAPKAHGETGDVDEGSAHTRFTRSG